MIATSGMLIRELMRLGDDFITVKLEGSDKEYIIDVISHEINYADSPDSHLCLKCRDGGDGEVKR